MRVVAMEIKLIFLNHTHPPLWVTSFLREVNLGTACGCEVFLFNQDFPVKSEHDMDTFFVDRHAGLYPARDDNGRVFFHTLPNL